MTPNFLSPLEFKIIVKRLPNVEFFTQRTTLPGISATPVIQPTLLNKLYATPDELTYNNLDMSFIIDEKMNNYLEIHRWLTALTFPQKFKQFADLKDSEDGLISDITIHILNSHKNSNIEIQYKNCFPISLSDVVLDTTQNDVIYPEANVMFQYDYYEINSLKVWLYWLFVI